jgi:rRNA processing protein Krr1/Pno1
LGWKEEHSISGQYVGWIKGARGQVVKDLTSRSGTRIDIEQPSREGDATIRIFGTYEGVRDAKRMIASELAKVNAEAAAEICSDYREYERGSTETALAVGGIGEGSNGNSMTVDIPNSCVGWLKGKQGAMIQDIETMSGAQVSIDQTTKDAGYAQVHISGSSPQMQTAQGLVVAEVMKVIHKTEERAEWGYIGSALELEVSAQYVGWLKGPKGKVVRDLTLRSATRIDIDQTSRELEGVAVVKVFGTQDGVEEARRLIAAELSKVSPEAAAQITSAAWIA